MGNKLARTTQISASEYYLHDLPSTCNLVLKEPLGGGRFLKSVLCIHDEGLVVVKVYFKRGEFHDLKDHERSLQKIREQLKKIEHSHVWPFQYWLETDKAAYLLRQFFFSNLHDRISTRPFLSIIEKKWIAFQLLLALKQSHERGVCHGDIKCENVLVTSWNWVYLADFASFKPTFLPVDNPADFSFFFDTGGRRRCYVAPERFFDPSGDAESIKYGQIKPAMDIFSVGCVIAELFMEGQALFDLSQLLAYRRGQYDPCTSLQKVHDVGIRDMILHMIQLDPEARLSAEQYMVTWGSQIFPSYFSPLLHSFFSCLLPLDSDTRVAVTQSAFSEICKQMFESVSMNHKNETLMEASNNKNVFQEEAQGGTKEVIDEEKCKGMVFFGHNKYSSHSSNHELIKDISALLRDGQNGVKGVIGGKTRILSSGLALREQSEGKKMDLLFEGSCLEDNICGPNIGLKPACRAKMAALAMSKSSLRQTDLTVQKVVLQAEETSIQEVTGGVPSINACKCEGMVLIASLLCASVRSVKLPQARRGAVQLLYKACLYIDDDTRLQHVLPYIVALLSDPAAIVRSAALQAVCNILSLVQSFPPSDAKVFPEYILPLLSLLPDDTEESVRICYADNIHKIAHTARHFLECSQYMTELGVLDRSLQAAKGQVLHQTGRYDLELSQLRETIARVILELVMGQKQTPTIRRAFLHHIGELCDFFGQKQCNDILLPMLPAFLNDRDEQLRAVFFEQIVHVCLFVGATSVEAYLLPYIEQALSDVEETVIVNALECLAALCVNRLMKKRVLLGAVERAAPLLCHPSQWVRQSAITFVASAGSKLELVDSYAFLLPILSPFVRREPISLCSESALLMCLKVPMSREAFNRVLSDAMLSQTPIASKHMKRPITQEPAAKLGYIKAASEQRKIEKESANTSLTSFKVSSGKRAGDRMSSAELDDGEKMKAMESYIRNLSSTMQSRMHNWELDNSEKLQSSIIVGGVGAGYYSNYDGSSEGIPLYSVPLGGENQAMISHTEDWSRMICVRHGAQPFYIATLSQIPSNLPISSHWVEGHTSLPAAFEARRHLPGMVGSFSSSKPVVGPRRVFDVVRDVGAKEGDVGFMSLTSSLPRAVPVSGRSRESHVVDSDNISSLEPRLGVLDTAFTPLVPEVQWRPRGVLIAHLQEHQCAVNDVCVSRDNSFFVSASDDGTVKVWDCKRLESNISFRSRLTQILHEGRALCTCMVGHGPQFAVASSNGTVHVFCVDYATRTGGNVERYSGLTEVRKFESHEGAVLSLRSYNVDASPLILYTTQRNGIHLCDMRVQKDAWCLKEKPSQGYISATAMDSCHNWLITATSRGVLTLWDLRFQIPVNTWQHPSGCLVESMCTPFSRSDISITSRPFVYVAAGRDEVALWNAEDGSCQQVFWFANDTSDSVNVLDVPVALVRPKLPSPAESKRNEGLKKSDYKLEELNEPPSRLPGVRALLPLSGGTGLLTGGTDCKICLWDQLRPDRSYCVCGPILKTSISTETLKYESRVVSGVKVLQEISNEPCEINRTGKRALVAAATDTTGCHRDCVLSLASAQMNQRLLISSSRDGSIKVWR